MNLKPLAVPLVRGRSWKDHGLLRTADVELFSGTDDEVARAERSIGRWIEDILHRHYYGHLWHVTVDARPSHMLATITHPLLPQRWAIRVKLDDLDQHGTLIVKLAGEFMERYRIPRAALDVDAFLLAKQMTRRLNAPPA